MFVLEAHGVGVAWSASAPVVHDVSFVLTPGFHGLVGANGSGKTTLLRVLAGELSPQEGQVLIRPGLATLVHCPQTVDDVGPDVEALVERHDAVASELKGRLSLDDAELERWDSLSPGERKRWQIAGALAREPDVLLLDEPTNHLDTAARARLLGALTRFRGIGVLVSHDRELLERLPRSILRVHDRTVTVHQGRYSDARASWERAREGQEEAHARSRAAVRAAERRLDVARRTQESAARSTSASARMKNKNDHDARSMGSKVVAGWADGRAGRAVELVRHELERARAKIEPIERDRTVGGKVFAAYERAPNAALLHLEAREVLAGKHVVLRDVRLTIGREERVRITGANGAGKTTLLTSLLAAHARNDRVLYLPQELEPEEIDRLVNDLRALDEAARGRVLSVFSALGSDPERLLSRRSSDAARLSPGEARKLALASGLGRYAWALVLDEPTNHLDLPTIERLERALEAYPGAVVLVTHDDAFAAAVTSRSLVVADGGVQ